MSRAIDRGGIPVLTSPRLVLRGPRIADIDALSAMWADPGVSRFISAAPTTRDGVWARFLNNQAHWDLFGHGYWAVDSREDRGFLGAVGLIKFRRGIDPACVDLPEAGWVFCRTAWGRGYASEAVAAMLAWADRTLNAASTVCIINPEHAASRRVAQNNGYTERDLAEFSGAAVQIMQRPRNGQRATHPI